MARNDHRISSGAVTWRVLKALLGRPEFRKAFRAVLKADESGVVSLGQRLEHWAKCAADAVAIRSGDRRWTYSEVNRIANRYAHCLESLGVGPGDRVALNCGNSPQMVFSLVALSKLGAVAALINTTQSGSSLAHSLKVAGAGTILADSEQAQRTATVPELTSGARPGRLLWLRGGADAHDSPPDGYVDLAEQAAGCSDRNFPGTQTVKAKDTAFLIFTSGTTGLPKAAILSWERWYLSVMVFGQMALGLTPRDTTYCCLPLYHTNALLVNVGSALYAGATVALSPKFSSRRFWDEVREYEVTSFTYVGEMLRYLLNQAPQPNDRLHKVIKIAGNGLRPDLWDEFKSRFGIERIHEFYGATESNNAFINLFNFDKTVGWSLGGWEIVAYDVDADEPKRDAQGRVTKLGPGETGLLITAVSASRPFAGYTDKAASEKKLFRSAFKVGDCWFYTGDLMRSLGAGHLQFVDRTGDTFRWNGENVATTEVEAVINAWPQSEDAVVYGVQVPDRDGRCGMVSYTLKAGEQLDPSGFAAWLRQCLPKYAVPRFMRIQQAQSLTGTLKHQKAQLKQDGYDLLAIKEPLWVLLPDGAAWVPLTPELRKAIDSGELRL